ncbi:MAG: hypothetical protein WCA59_13100 [Candidatus Binataceae bacterium]
MNAGHVAALALVGWYLMLPPIRPDGSVNANAPLSKWETSNSYNTADECKKVLLGLRGGWVGYANGHELNYPSQKDTAACIATDDPRLKGNYDTPLLKPGHLPSE